MSTNTFAKTAQKEINLDGSKYFASGTGHEANLARNASARFAVDPLTNKKVNKASAATYADASGRVFYFESDESFNGFIALATPQTVYGYSAAK